MNRDRPRILLINPFIYDFTAFDCWAKPKGLLEVGSIIRQFGFDVDFIDCLDRHDKDMMRFVATRPHIRPAKPKKFSTGKYFQEECQKPLSMKTAPRHYYRFGFHPELLAEKLQTLEAPPVLVGITGIMTYWWDGARDTISIAKKYFPATPVVLGGIYPSLLPEHAAAFSGADLIFTGRATPETIGKMLTRAGLARLFGKFSSSGHEPVYYPYPDPSCGVINLSEGCHKQCTYCASRLLRPRLIPYDLSQVYRQIEYLAALGIVDFAFYDDFLLLDKENRLLPLLCKTAANLPHIRFHTPNGMHLVYIDTKGADILKRAHFKTLRFGFETADRDLLQRTGQKIRLTDFADKVNILKAAGFKGDEIGIYIMVGLPGQTAASVAESLEFVKSCDVATYLTEFSPIPGTAEFAHALRNSPVDFLNNPELQNNSLLSLRDPAFPEETVNRLKDFAYGRTNRSVPEYRKQSLVA